MDIIQQLESNASKSLKYQATLVFLCFGLWVNIELLLVLLSFLELPSTVVKFNQLDLIYDERVLAYSDCNSSYFEVSWTYHSWVREFEIQCSPLKTSILGSLSFIGLLVGALAYSFIADSLGRKKTHVLSAAIYGVLLFVSVFSRHLYVIFGFQLVAGFVVALASCNFPVLISECVEPKLRSLAFGIISSGFAFCGFSYILIVWYTNSWRITFIISGTACLVCSVGMEMCFVEPPRFYLLKADFKGFLSSLREIAKFNGCLEEFDKSVDYPNCLSEENRGDSVVSDLIQYYQDKSKFKGKQYNFMDLLRFRSQRTNFLLAALGHFILNSCYYGFSIYIKLLPGNVYVNGIIIYALELVSYMILAQSANIAFLGRKYTSMVYTGISTFLYFVLYLNYLSPTAELVMAICCRVSLSAVYNISTVWFAELFPTSLRACSAGYLSIASRLGGVITPFIIEMVPEHSNLIYSTFLGCSLISFVFISETVGKPLPTVIPEEKDEKEPLIS